MRPWRFRSSPAARRRGHALPPGLCRLPPVRAEQGQGSCRRDACTTTKAGLRRPSGANPTFGREQQPGAASRHSRFNEPPRPAVRLLDARACPEQAPRTLRWRLLLRLAERHCDPGGVRVEVHRLVDRRGDALVTGSQAATVRTGTRLTQTTRTTPLFGCDQVRAVVLTAASLRSRPPPAGCTAGDHDARPPTRRVAPTTHARPPALEASPTQRPGPHNADAHHQRGTSQTTCHPPRPDQPNQTVTE